MRNLILQLFVNKNKLVAEIEALQKEPREKWNKELIDAKHAEWDRIEHTIDLFFLSVGL